MVAFWRIPSRFVVILHLEIFPRLEKAPFNWYSVINKGISVTKTDLVISSCRFAAGSYGRNLKPLRSAVGLARALSISELVRKGIMTRLASSAPSQRAREL